MIETTILLAIAAVSGLLIGFALGVHDAHRRLREQVDDLERRVDEFNAAMDRDPERAALDLGQEYVLNMLENFMAQVRAHIADRRKRDTRIN